ncbi:hypothetical protein DFH27DRAFT_554882 [Peziza echinospora]|nr:hypothetical protein DFH27DRAFT_554882 [Peziza echinospora]
MRIRKAAVERIPAVLVAAEALREHVHAGIGVALEEEADGEVDDLCCVVLCQSRCCVGKKVLFLIVLVLFFISSEKDRGFSIAILMTLFHYFSFYFSIL